MFTEVFSNIFLRPFDMRCSFLKFSRLLPGGDYPVAADGYIFMLDLIERLSALLLHLYFPFLIRSSSYQPPAREVFAKLSGILRMTHTRT